MTTSEQGSSIGHMTDWKSMCLMLRQEVTKLHATLDEVREQAALASKEAREQAWATIEVEEAVTAAAGLAHALHLLLTDPNETTETIAKYELQRWENWRRT